MPILGCARCGVRRQVAGWVTSREACACGGQLTLAAGATQELEPRDDRAALLARAGLAGIPAGAEALEGTIDDGAVIPLPRQGDDPDRTSDEERIIPLPGHAPPAATGATYEDARVLELPDARPRSRSGALPRPAEPARSPFASTAKTLEDARVLDVPVRAPASPDPEGLTRSRSGPLPRSPGPGPHARAPDPSGSGRPRSATGALPRPASQTGPPAVPAAASDLAASTRPRSATGALPRPTSHVGPVQEGPHSAATDATFKDDVVLVPPEEPTEPHGRSRTGAHSRPASAVGPRLGATQEDARVMPIPDESRQASAVAPPPKRTAHEVPVVEPVVLPAPALRVGGYELREAIGHGGFAAVYRAWDPKHEREVALKVLERLDPKARARFQRELLATARLRHPNIVGLLDSGKDDKGRPYLVLELVRGPTLSEAWRGACRSAADVAGRVRAVKDLARALEHSHASGVLHRDVKPENVLLDEAGRARLIDLGLARIGGGEALTQEGDAYGTPSYMSPEQAGSGDVVDARSDVYSLGATLYRGLTGQPPFEGSGVELFLAIFREEPASPETLASHVPPELSAICLRCLEKDPDRRYATMGELGDELERWLAGAPLVTRTPGRVDRLRRGLERQLAPLAAATIGLLLGVVGSQVLLTLLPPEPQVAAAPAPGRRAGGPEADTTSAKRETAGEAEWVDLDPSGAPVESSSPPAAARSEMKGGQKEGLAGESSEPARAPAQDASPPAVRPPDAVEPELEPELEPEPQPVRRRAPPPPPAEAGLLEAASLPAGLGLGLAVLALLGVRSLLRRQQRASALTALARWQAARLGTEATEVAEPPAP